MSKVADGWHQLDGASVLVKDNRIQQVLIPTGLGTVEGTVQKKLPDGTWLDVLPASYHTVKDNLRKGRYRIICKY